MNEIEQWIRHLADLITSTPKGPDLVVFGFQEWADPLGFGHPSIGDLVAKIQSLVQNHFSTGSYDLIKFHKWIGLVLVLVSSTNQALSKMELRRIRHAVVGTGPLMMGNKGAIGMLVDWTLDASGRTVDSAQTLSICFVNSHFPPLSGNVALRRESYQSICSRLAFPPPEESKTRESTVLMEADIVVWFGDLNSRLYDPSFYLAESMTSPEPIPNLVGISPNPPLQPLESDSEVLAVELAGQPVPQLSIETDFYHDLVNDIKTNRWNSVFKYDQLRYDIQFGWAFKGFSEPPINFPPTYKYNRSSSILNMDKDHLPCWCDRILFLDNTGQTRVRPLLYGSCQSLESSDHKPVHGYFAVDLTGSVAHPLATKAKSTFGFLETLGHHLSMFLIPNCQLVVVLFSVFGIIFLMI